MNRQSAFCAAIVAFLWVGCGKSDSSSIVVVTVTAPPTMPVVTQLSALVSNAGSSDTKLFPQVQSATPIQFDTTFAVTFPKSRSGELAIAVDALDAVSQVVGTGSDSVVIAAGGRADLIIHLALVATDDAGAPGVDAGNDGPGWSDVTIADGKGAPDVLQAGSDARELGGAGGISGSGGAVATGGVSATGGVTATGGATGSGGAVGTGGRVGSGGAIGSGGMVGTGGVVSTGGVVGSGGGGGGSAAACANATPISGSVSLGTTAAFCFVTCDGTTMGWGCDSFTEKERTVKVNGTSVICGGTLPAQKPGGYYYFEIGAGGHAWDAIHVNGPKVTSCPVPEGGFSP